MLVGCRAGSAGNGGIASSLSPPGTAAAREDSGMGPGGLGTATPLGVTEGPAASKAEVSAGSGEDGMTGVVVRATLPAVVLLSLRMWLSASDTGTSAVRGSISAACWFVSVPLFAPGLRVFSTLLSPKSATFSSSPARIQTAETTRADGGRW